MKINFLGATDDVTGSMTLLETPEGKILVDAGLYQGQTGTVKKNFRQLPFDPKTIAAIVLTHAHLDHSGLVPRLVKLGFRGSIFCTRPTLKLARVIMTDSAHIMEREEEDLALKSFYSMEDVMVTTSLFKSKKFYETFNVAGMTISFQPAGHILGASSAIIDHAGKKYVFSGDLGRNNDPLIKPGDKCPATDVLIMESTYGAKDRKGDLHDDLINFVKKIKNESRVGIIASFAVARSQLLITLLHKYFQQNPKERVRFVIDGPMMTDANNVYKEFAHDTNLEQDLKDALVNVEIIDHLSEWISISKKGGPLLILASSGMLTGGKIWRYLENWQDDENAVIFLPGYQGEGTPGKSLLEGNRFIQDKTGKRIHWAGDVITSEAFSSHADQSELIDWISEIDKNTEIFLIHGEETSKTTFKEKLQELGYKHVTIARPSAPHL